MAWSYDPSLTADRDLVRFLLGDTDQDNQLLSNEELEAVLGRSSSPDEAAASSARALSARFARLVDKEVGDLRISFSQQARQFAELARTIELNRERRLLLTAQGSRTSDRDEPQFIIGQNDTRGRGYITRRWPK